MNKSLNRGKSHPKKSKVEIEEYYARIAKTASWATIEACVPPEQVLTALESAGIGFPLLFRNKSRKAT